MSLAHLSLEQDLEVGGVVGSGPALEELVLEAQVDVLALPERFAWTVLFSHRRAFIKAWFCFADG